MQCGLTRSVDLQENTQLQKILFSLCIVLTGFSALLVATFNITLYLNR